MKNLLLSTLLLTVAACSTLSNDQYTGKSVTFGGDNILRDDVTQEIVRVVRITNPACHSVDHIDADIVNEGQIKNGLRMSIQRVVERSSLRQG